MPIRQVVGPTESGELTSDGLLAALSYVERKYDNASLNESLAVPARTAAAGSRQPKERI